MREKEASRELDERERKSELKVDLFLKCQIKLCGIISTIKY